ncbi:NACHT domain-containing protein [Roseobacter sp. EG26]|uniref:NACHT domain-containing protein n=1 Tax=Roseobacter sp. EG26 TaxID=3412477 RepID=UPI003CE53AF6
MKSTYQALIDWVHDENDFQPIALLGGYGSGKTSVAKKIASELAKLSVQDYTVRRPILIRLGNITRYSAVDGILGGLFTSEVPVRNFNLPNFQKLNEKGHFLIILDGFDEMKHSMSWADFKAQVQALLQLHKERSKVLLLGRPSAFLSEDEERHILKGQRRLDENWVRLPNWPSFRELELREFTPAQRRDFVVKYIAHNGSANLGRLMRARFFCPSISRLRKWRHLSRSPLLPCHLNFACRADAVYGSIVPSMRSR